MTNNTFIASSRAAPHQQHRSRSHRTITLTHSHLAQFGHYYVGDDTSVAHTALQLFTMFGGIAILSGFIAIMWQVL